MPFLSDTESMQWLAEVHCPIAQGYCFAVLHGRYDDPDKVELYARNHYKCRPTVLESNEDRILVVIKWGEQPSRRRLRDAFP